MSTLPVLIAAALLFDPARTEMIDLTHAFDAKTLYWPTSPSEFEHKMLSKGKTPGGWFYSAAAFCAPEHGGTHLDAPIHFSEGGDSSATLPLDKLVAPAIVIDVSAKADVDADYRLSVADIEAWEKAHRKIHLARSSCCARVGARATPIVSATSAMIRRVTRASSTFLPTDWKRRSS